MKSNTSHRLKEILSKRNLRQIDVINLAEPFCEKYGLKLTKSDLSQYISGKVVPGQEKLSILGMALNVSEAWLMGYDVPIERDTETILKSAAKDRILHEKFESLTQKEKEIALDNLSLLTESKKNKPAEQELDELDLELLRLAAQLTPEQKRRQVETLRDIVGKKDN